MRLHEDEAATKPAPKAAGPLATAGTTVDLDATGLVARVVEVTLDEVTGKLNGYAVSSLGEIEVIARGERALRAGAGSRASAAVSVDEADNPDARRGIDARADLSWSQLAARVDVGSPRRPHWPTLRWRAPPSAPGSTCRRS